MALIGLLKRLFRRDPPLIRTRSTGRPRTYSADSGYVYQYAFSGFRRIRRSGENYIEYVFDVSGGREPAVAVSVLLAETRLAEWSGVGRELTASERYGVAKLAMKAELDRSADPKSLVLQVMPGQEEVRDIAETLDL